MPQRQGLEQRRVGVSRDASGDLFIELFLILVIRDLVFLAAFFAQPNSSVASLHEIGTQFHLQHGVDPRESVDRHADEGAIPQLD